MIQIFKQLKRLLYINRVLARNGLDQAAATIPLLAPFRFLTYLNPWNWLRKEPLSRGVALRKSLEELGPIFIKFGQALSTRPDILPPDIALELCNLQDNVPPFPSEVALSLIESAYGRSAAEVFAQFDENPLASASMAQVHAAVLRTGESVVVKILRPGMYKIIKQDLSILYTVAHWIDKYWTFGKRLKLKEVVKEFEYNIHEELDLQREAANASQLRRNFLHSPLLYIPEVYWDYTHENILVLERIHGIPVADVETLHHYGINIKKLAERGVEIFFTQVFRDCFFHADMHPGNIFVSYHHAEEPQYICIDFGIIGTLSEADKRYLAENLYAFFNRDYRKVASLHVESGWVAKDTRIAEFESAIRTVCEPIFEKPLKDISFAQMILKLSQVARRFHMEVQPQLVLLQKTLLAVEGLGRQLYPDLDLWATAKPFLQNWLKNQIGPSAFLKQLKENLPFYAEQLPHMPRLLYDVLESTKLEKSKTLSNTLPEPTPPKAFNVGIGVFWAMLLMAGLSYLQIFTTRELGATALIAAIFAGGFIFFNQNKRG